MSAYAEYQDINLPWLKAIPAHWEVRRNKNIFTEQKEIVGEKSSNYTLLSLTLNGIVPRDMDGGGKFPESFDKYKIVRIGDMAFCLFDIDETPRTVGLSGHDGMLTGAYTIMHVSNINSRFIYYYYLALDNGKMLKPLYSGLRKTININTFQSTKVPVPPRDEQDQIVRFLDWKVSSINKLISNYRHQIALLDEMKQQRIDKAVVKGLHERSFIHNDDIRWDIDYPEHWQIRRIRESFSFRKGLSITKANLEETGIAVISYGQIHSKKNSGVGLNEELIRYVNKTYLTTNRSCLVEKGDFIFADTSEDVSGCGNCAYVDQDDTIFAGYHSIIAHPAGSTNNKYLAYLFKSPTWRCQIRKKVNGVKVYSITQAMLKDAFILIPPATEQEEIVRHLDEVCAKIDAIIKKMEEKIENLQDLKIRLIADTVTGKIDVRGIEIPEYEFVEETIDGDSEGCEEETEEQED
uniref:restriction endonuclease subunit S n=1 Tax=Dialister sp. TaxID=1955814 RepID=UPI0040283D44